MASDRIRKMKSTIMSIEETSRIIPCQTIEYAPDETKSPYIRHAGAVEALFRQAAVNHMKGERIVGNNTIKYSPRPNHLTRADMEDIKNYPRNVSDEILAAMDERIFYLWAFSVGHVIPDNDLIMKKGLNHLMGEIEERLAGKSLEESQREFLQAALMECRGFRVYVKRHEGYSGSPKSPPNSMTARTILCAGRINTCTPAT